MPPGERGRSGREGRGEGEREVEERLDEGGEGAGRSGGGGAAGGHRGVSAAAGLGSGVGEGRADEAAGALDRRERRAADDADEVEQAEVGGEANAVAAVGVEEDLADEDVGRVEAAVAGGDDAVAGAERVALVDEVEGGGGAVVAGDEGALAGGTDDGGNAARGVGEEEDARRSLGDAGDAADEAEAVEDGRAVGDAVEVADVDHGGAAEGAAGVGHDLAGDEGHPRVEPDLVEGEEPGVLLLELERGLAPALHALELAAELGVLRVDAGVGAEVGEHPGGGGDGLHRPRERRDEAVDEGHAELLDAGVVDAPEQEERDEQQAGDADEDAPDAAEVVGC